MISIPEVDGLDVAFPTKAMQILPKWEDIPDDFRRERGAAKKWIELVETWFFRGIKDAVWKPKPGVDTKKALMAIKACIGDWGPSHEHKTAGVAFLLSEWFEDVTYKPSDKKLKEAW